MRVPSQCDTHEHQLTKMVALVLVMLWPVGMLGLFAVVLVRNRKELRAGRAKNVTARAVKFLTGGYRPT